jgi:hypothetical protein
MVSLVHICDVRSARHEGTSCLHVQLSRQHQLLAPMEPPMRRITYERQMHGNKSIMYFPIIKDKRHHTVGFIMQKKASNAIIK